MGVPNVKATHREPVYHVCIVLHGRTVTAALEWVNIQGVGLIDLHLDSSLDYRIAVTRGRTDHFSNISLL